MTQKNDGGPAYPWTDQNADGTPYNQYAGMSLRQYAAIELRVPESGLEWLDDMIRQAKRDEFAGQALNQAVEDYGQPTHGNGSQQRRNLGNPVLPYSASRVGSREEIIARQAYRYADAMIAARSNT